MCEMDVLSWRTASRPATPLEPNYAQFDRLFLNGCTALPSDQLKKLSRNPPDGEAVMIVTLERSLPSFHILLAGVEGPEV